MNTDSSVSMLSTLPIEQLAWTTDTPTKPGWYWYRGPESDGDVPVIARVYEAEGGMWAEFIERFFDRVELLRGEWAGPLEPPT